jgi:hypothetical protein
MKLRQSAEQLLSVLHAAHGTNDVQLTRHQMYALASNLATIINDANGHEIQMPHYITNVDAIDAVDEFIAQRTEPEPEPELDASQVEIPDTYCPACGAFDHDRLGQLGNLFWFRCTCCGIDYSKEVTQ